ncbi:hypothetical protein QR680_012946 [Steinernema hermaphroditum]|uniref:SWIM-type domain-containing protein n=1 Tax=Steinernema hermaphroditum TaxID=289476 RepID=A0AA39I6E7_9BILA|nr:hypothetical protein QR680_012946 [Steinernema hermaphroditum]
MTDASTSQGSYGEAQDAHEDEAEQLRMAGRIELVLRELENDLRTASNPLNDKKRFEVLGTLYNLLGRIVVDAVGLVESRSVKRVSDVAGRHTLIEVCPKISGGFAYQLYPKVNYCICSNYQDKVIKEQSSFTCEHVLAGRLAECMNVLTEETTPHMEGMFERLRRFIPEIY